MRKIGQLLLLLAFLTGCTKGKNNSDYSTDPSCLKITIDPKKTIDREFNDIVKNPIFIQLETNSSCLLKRINKVQIYKNRIYVYGSDETEKAFCFDRQGKYLFTIGAVGNGPGEYIRLRDIHVDRLNNCIWLGDDGKRILKFDLDGKLIEQYATEFSIKNIFSIEKDVLAIRLGYYADKHYSFITYSPKDRKIIYYKDASNSVDQIIGAQVFSMFDGEIIYAAGFNDTIFNVKKSGLTPKYAVDFGNYKVPQHLFKADDRNLIANFLNPKNRYAGLIGYPYETADYLIFHYDFSGEGLLAFYSKANETVVNIQNIIVNGKKLNAFRYFFKSKMDEGHVSVLESHLLTEREEDEKPRQTYGRYADFDHLLLNLRADDNPVLILSDVGL